MWSQGGEQISSYDQFIELFCHVFDHAPEGKVIGEQLLSVTQGNYTGSPNTPWCSEHSPLECTQGNILPRLTEHECHDKQKSLDTLTDFAL